MYLTYDEYTDFGGTLDESIFEEYEFEAESHINWYTFNRLKNDTEFSEEVLRCVYALIKLCANKANLLSTTVTDTGTATTSSAITSQSNDGVSVSYNVISATDAYKLCEAEVGNLIKRYLADVTNEAGNKLLYRGLYEGE